MQRIPTVMKTFIYEYLAVRRYQPEFGWFRQSPFGLFRVMRGFIKEYGVVLNGVANDGHDE